MPKAVPNAPPLTEIKAWMEATDSRLASLEGQQTTQAAALKAFETRIADHAARLAKLEQSPLPPPPPPPPLPYGPRVEVGPSVALTAADSAQLARKVTVSARTTAGIQAAIAAAQSQGIGTVLLPAGDYPLSGSVHVPAGIALFGEGSGTVLRATSANQYLFILRAGAGPVRFSRMVMQGLSQTWVEIAQNNTYGVFIEGHDKVLLDHLEQRGFAYANHVTGGATVRMEACYAHHNLVNGLGYGINIHAGSWARIADCRFSQCRHAQASGLAGVSRKGHWEVLYCDIDDNRQAGNPCSALDTHPDYTGTFRAENNRIARWRSVMDVQGQATGIIRRNRMEALLVQGVRFIGGAGRVPNGIRIEENDWTAAGITQMTEILGTPPVNVTWEGAQMWGTTSGPPPPPVHTFKVLDNGGLALG